jgi:hypothetical protein
MFPTLFYAAQDAPFEQGESGFDGVGGIAIRVASFCLAGFLLTEELPSRVGRRLYIVTAALNLPSACRRGAWIKNLRLSRPFAVLLNDIRLGCAVHLACGKEHCCGPGGEKIESGDKFRGKGG